MAGTLIRASLVGVLLWPMVVAASDVADDNAFVEQQCGTCHRTPLVGSFPAEQWPTVLRWMDGILGELGHPRVDPATLVRLKRYYQTHAPEKVLALPKDPAPDPSTFVLDPSFEVTPHSVTHVNAADLDQDGRIDLLVSESGGFGRPAGQVSWLRRAPQGEGWTKTVLAQTPNPAHTEVFDFEGDGDLDVVVAVLGIFGPSERNVGGVLLLEADGRGEFVPRTLLEGVGRVADVRPGDFNGDGRVDFAVAIFGHRRGGSVGWLEQTDLGGFAYHELLRKAGAVHVPVVDLNGDGALDIVALVSQESETVFAYLGNGAGSFQSRKLFQGPPEFGASGIEVVDLDRDGDLDILLSNGDTADTGAKTRTKFRSHHGVRWLENTKPHELRFESRPITSFYGAHGVTAGDIDGDGDLDIAVGSFLTDLGEPDRQSLGWWENDGAQNFTGHGLARMPINLTTLALVDLDDDGRLDLIAGGMKLPGYAEARTRFQLKPTLSLWRGRGAADALGAEQSRDERLRALGYLDYAQDADSDESPGGVTRFDPVRAQPGYNLVVSSLECAARLTDMSGQVVFTWQQQKCHSWLSAEWLPGGDLVVNGRLHGRAVGAMDTAGSTDRFTARIAPDGKPRWLRAVRAHHQIDWTPRDEVLVLVESTVSAERFRALELKVGPHGTIHENPLQWIDADGELLGSLSLFDAVTDGRVDFDFVEVDAMQEGPGHIGIFHANSAYAMDQPHLASTKGLYASDNVLVTSRNQDRIFVVSRQRKSLVWQWGKGELSRPHDATWLGNGNILVFDNRVERGSSRVLEVDPRRNRIVWQYPPTEGGERFFSRARGSAQRLENGNTLIVVSQAGTAFEVTPAGDTVWHYRAPLRANGRRSTLVLLKRYPHEWRLPYTHQPS